MDNQIFNRKRKMANILAFYVTALTLVSVSLATSDYVVLYSEDEKQLQVKYEKTITLKTKNLKLTFYEDCINKDPKVCISKTEDNSSYLRYFSESEKQECKHFEQISQSTNDILQFCVDMENSSWFGGAETSLQEWPLNKLNWTDRAYVTKELDSQAVVESYFLNSDGFYIYINDSVALFVDINGPKPGKMCFTSKLVAPYKKVRNIMQFRICKFNNPRIAHENAIKDYLGTPTSIPDPYVIKYPIWSTWARYKIDVNTSSVLSYAEEIVKNGFQRGTFEIDDKWETCYGSAEFDVKRFQNINDTAFGNGIEYRSSRRSQEVGYLLRMIDRESRWNYELGLPTLITSLIHLNMVGYPFVLQDMIGGNGYNNLPPSKEMYIRWMQAAVFMPVVQFSYTPWDFDSKTLSLCRHFMDLRSNFTNTIVDLMKNTVANGSPVNPPVWWIDPTDTDAYTIDDQFMLSENILVAPVLVEGAISRNIYLPTGLWRDENNPGSSLFFGRTWLINYPASLEVLSWFTRVSSESVSEPSNSVCHVSTASYIFVLGLIVCLCR